MEGIIIDAHKKTAHLFQSFATRTGSMRGEFGGRASQ